MGFFDKMASTIKEAFQEADRELSRLVDRSTFRRVCEAAFLVARADGTFDDSEKAMLQRLIAAKLPQFRPAEILSAIDAAQGELAFTVDGGIGMLLTDIGRAKGTDEAPLIMMAAMAIGSADGTFDDDERAVARRICEALGLDAGSYQL